MPDLFTSCVRNTELLELKIIAEQECKFKDDVSPRAVACLLRDFILQLPEPLIPDTYYEYFVQTAGMTNLNVARDVLKEVIAEFDDINYWVLHDLLQLLSQVVEQNSNKEQLASNLSVIFGASIIKPKANQPITKLNAQYQCAAVELMISNFDIIFGKKELPMKAQTPVSKSTLRTIDVVDGKGKTELRRFQTMERAKSSINFKGVTNNNNSSSSYNDSNSPPSIDTSTRNWVRASSDHPVTAVISPR